MQVEELKSYARLRNGVETVPSNLRMNYHLGKMPRGRQRGKFFFGCKIAALNFEKLFNLRRGLGHYAQYPVIVSEDTEGIRLWRYPLPIKQSAISTKYKFFKVLKNNGVNLKSV